MTAVRADDRSSLAPPQAVAPRGRRARDVMISDPKTLPTDASIEDVRAVLTDEHVHMVLLTHAQTLHGTLIRADLPTVPSHGEPALAWAVLTGRTVNPDTPADRVEEMLIRSRMRRLAVVDSARTLLGLVCMKSTWSGFCADADLAARAAASVATQDGAAR